MKWAEARLLVLNSESRALRAVDDLVVAGESLSVSADSYAGSAGISAAVPQMRVARECLDSVSREAHAGGQQPA